MFRLTLISFCAVFVVMLIGGQDRGQQRFGLQARQEEPAPAPAAAREVERPVTEVAYAPVQPVMLKPVVAVDAPKEDVAVAPEAPREEVPVEPIAIMYVDATSINVREGPGKTHQVIGRLTRGEAVQVVSQDGTVDGWSLIRIEGDGLEGFVASQLLVQ